MAMNQPRDANRSSASYAIRLSREDFEDRLKKRLSERFTAKSLDKFLPAGDLYNRTSDYLRRTAELDKLRSQVTSADWRRRLRLIPRIQKHLLYASSRIKEESIPHQPFCDEVIDRTVRLLGKLSMNYTCGIFVAMFQCGRARDLRISLSTISANLVWGNSRKKMRSQLSLQFCLWPECFRRIGSAEASTTE